MARRATSRPVRVSTSRWSRRIGAEAVARVDQAAVPLTEATASGGLSSRWPATTVPRRPAWRMTADPPIDQPQVTTRSKPSDRAAATAASTSSTSRSPRVVRPVELPWPRAS